LENKERQNLGDQGTDGWMVWSLNVNVHTFHITV
jgi:hypothetical protein